MGAALRIYISRPQVPCTFPLALWTQVNAQIPLRLSSSASMYRPAIPLAAELINFYYRAMVHLAVNKARIYRGKVSPTASWDLGGPTFPVDGSFGIAH